MQTRPETLPPQIETIAELRELYRAAEARAARLRLLSATGRDLAEAGSAGFEAPLQRAAERLAFFVGSRSARLVAEAEAGAIALPAPGPDAGPVGWIVIEGLASADAIPDAEDREAFGMHLELMGATLHRIAAERERAGLLSALRDREARLELLVSRMFSAQEEERRRVSQDLHDGVAQTATALVRMLEGGGAQSGEDLSAAGREQLAAIARGLVRELRAVIGGLRPTLLDDLGLVAALQSLAEGLEAEGYAVSLHFEGDTARLAAPVETALFRVAQEAFSNIRKHAGGPCAVRIELLLREDGERVLRITDSGHGPAAPQAEGPPGSHVGIDVMRERMAAIGGSLAWRAGPGGGVSVSARLPGGVTA